MNHPLPIFQDKLDVSLHKNSASTHGSTSERANTFFSKIPNELILELYEYCKRDYDMFGYPIPKVISQIDI